MVGRYPALAECAPAAEALAKELIELFESGKTLFLAGNGGSAADAEHICGELLKGFKSRRELSADDKALLASVGGKTAVDTDWGKNLVGAFHQPKLVVIDCSLLKTLDKREIAAGMAEIVKTGMILDRDFLLKLETIRTLENKIGSDSTEAFKNTFGEDCFGFHRIKSELHRTAAGIDNQNFHNFSFWFQVVCLNFY